MTDNITVNRFHSSEHENLHAGAAICTLPTVTYIGLTRGYLHKEKRPGHTVENTAASHVY